MHTCMCVRRDWVPIFHGITTLLLKVPSHQNLELTCHHTRCPHAGEESAAFGVEISLGEGSNVTLLVIGNSLPRLPC